MKDPKIERHLQNGNQNFLFDSESGQNYVLSTIEEERINENLIFKCDENGNITDWNEVWACRPSVHHWRIIEDFVNGKLKLEKEVNKMKFSYRYELKNKEGLIIFVDFIEADYETINDTIEKFETIGFEWVSKENI